MHRLRQVLWLIIIFEVGVILVVLPWLRVWDSNYFLAHYPMLRPYFLHPSFRGAITGLGALDILLAADMAWRNIRATQTRRI
jgi:hypothetical protein